MGCAVFRTRIRFDLHDASHPGTIGVDAHEKGPEQAAGSLGRIHGEQGAREAPGGVLDRDAERPSVQRTSRTRSESGISGPVLAMKTGISVSIANRPTAERVTSV